jgi:hypothetical protein
MKIGLSDAEDKWPGKRAALFCATESIDCIMAYMWGGRVSF